MNCYICGTCGTQYAASAEPPTDCKVCSDDRQHVGWDGQTWTTLAELADRLHVRIERDGAFLGIGVVERFGIPQRALLVPTGAGTVMWDCTTLVTSEAVDAINAMGGVAMIAISHPHFYSSMVEWSEALGGVPILLHAADAEWVARPSPLIRHWSGDRLAIADDATLIHLPGHFPGSSALSCADPTDPARRVLLTGDSLHVAGDRRHITVMHSVPNYLPVGPSTIRDLRRRLEGVAFDDVYGFTWGLNLIGDAETAVAASFDRYLAAISDRDTSAVA
jgi:glyoxylase-like metal-dependent hydrolase (beta-lactamase superfamily II)